MNNVGNNIRKYRKLRGLTQLQVSNRMGKKNTSAIQQYELGVMKPKINVLQNIAEILECNVSDLDETLKLSKTASAIIKIPVLGSIRAGIPTEAIEDVLEWEEIPNSWITGNREYFALKIKGDSMQPLYCDGDIVIFLKTNTCDNGKDCAVMINGDDGTFKKVISQPNGIILQPINPNYETKYYSKKDVEELPVTVVGIAKEIRRKVN